MNAAFLVKNQAISFVFINDDKEKKNAIVQMHWGKINLLNTVANDRLRIFQMLLLSAFSGWCVYVPR